MKLYTYLYNRKHSNICWSDVKNRNYELEKDIVVIKNNVPIKTKFIDIHNDRHSPLIVYLKGLTLVPLAQN